VVQLIAFTIALLLSIGSVQAQTSTFRWWHNTINGYSFGETLAIYGDMTKPQCWADRRRRKPPGRIDAEIA
jgi:hypothetical protein